MMIHIIDLLFISRRTRVAFYNESPVQILESVKQQFTEHCTILYAFLVFTA